MAKEFLSQKRVQYKDYDVSVDREKAQEMVKKSGQMGVPVIVVDDEVIIGFNRKRLEELMSQKQPAAGAQPTAGNWKPTLGAKISDADYAIPGTVGGSYVSGINSGSTAEAAGLKAGDIITEISGSRVNSANDVIDVVRAAKQGDSVPVTVKRGDQEVKTTLVFK